jgi:glycosyltransferase involved in cell wall biosynthesis
MRIVFLHTIPCRYEINNLILDISLNVKKTDFQFFEFPCLWSSGNFVLNLFKLRKFIKKNRIDVIHVYDYLDAYWVHKIAKYLNVKLVFSEYFYHDELKGYKNHIYKAVLKNVNHIISQSDCQRNYMMNSFDLTSEKCSKLYHAFCLKRFDNFDYKSVRDEFFIDDLRYLIGTIGDFTPQRNMMSVFKMIKKLRRTGRNFTCVVAGGQVDEYDENYNECKYYYILQGLDNYITYMGRRYDDANLLSQLDVFVYNSAREVVALPVIKAMISGVNVVVNDCDMIREITCNGKYASLYKDNDSSDFAVKTRYALLDLEDNKLISQVVKEETRMIFSIERHIKGLKQIYSKIITD